MRKPIRSLVSSAVIGVIASATVNAGGFSLYTEGSASAIGNYAAGAAAEASTAATGWYNPAGLALLDETQAILGGVGVFPRTVINGFSSYTSTIGGVTYPTYTQNFAGLDGGRDALVPSFHFAKPVSENITLGLSVVSPFGLSTDWDDTSPVRYAATFTELLTINVSPEIGARVNEHFSVGAGIDLQYSRVKFNSMLGSPSLLDALNFPANQWDSSSYNQGKSFGVGFHAGVLTMFNDNHSRIGLNYQSRIRHKFNGYSILDGLLADPINPPSGASNPNTRYVTNNLFSNNIEFPDIVTLSGYHDVNEDFALLGSVVYTGWDVFKQIQLVNVAARNPTTGVNTPAKSTAAQNYNNAWRFALGANYRVNEKLMMRGGFGYDQTPTNDIDRDVRLPDADRWALSIGAHYAVNPEIDVDLGYTYLFASSDTTISKTQAIGTSTVYTYATSKPYANLVGLQVMWHVDKPEKPVMTK